MPSVFVVNHSGYSYEPAKEFGELVYMSRGIIDISTEFQDLKRKFANLIDSSKPDDYLLLTGSVLLCAEAVKLWVDKHKLCRIVQWDTKKGGYSLYEL